MPRPPEPLDGWVPIAEYGDKTGADVALSALLSEGFEATLSYDPALSSNASFFASDRTYELVVRAEDAEAAVAALEVLVTGLPEEFSEEHALDYRTTPRRRRVRRIALFLVLGWFSIPIVIILVIELASRL